MEVNYDYIVRERPKPKLVKQYLAVQLNCVERKKREEFYKPTTMSKTSMASSKR